MVKIGHVQVDIYKAERQFHHVSLSDVNCIKALIKFRSMLDCYLGIETNRTETEAGDIYPLNQELLITYIDLDNLIERADLNIKHRFIIARLMEGYNEEEVAAMFDQKPDKAYKALDVIANRIKELNDYDWKYEYMYVNNIKVPWSYKKCIKCGEFKPSNKDFFSPDKRNKDGLRGICKTCR